MKIIYIANARIPTEKAHGSQIMNMTESFAALGNEVELLIPSRGKDQTDPFVFYKIKPVFSIKKFFCLNLVSFGPIGFLVQTLSFFISAYSHILRSGADIIYSRDPLILFLLSFRRKNLVWEAHTKKDDFVTRKLVKRLRALVCISAGLKDHYLYLGIDQKKVMVAHDAVNPAIFDSVINDKNLLRKELFLPADKIIVSYVGKYKTMGMSKGVEELVEIFQRAFLENNNLFFLFVGINNDELNEFQNICKKSGLPDGAYKIVCHIPQIEAIKNLKASDIAVMNYPNIPHYAKYMSPLKMFEYMASGCAIVSTDLPSVREVLTDKGNSLLVRPGDIPAFVQAIILLSADPELRKRLSDSALKLVYDKYTWNKRAGEIISQVSVLVKSRKILMTSDTFLPEIGGAEVHIKNLIEEMTKIGHNIILFTNEGKVSNFDSDYPVYRIPWKRSSVISIIKTLWKLSDGVDLIHCHYCYRMAFFACIIARIRRVPTVITLHGMGILNHPDTPFLYQIAHSTYRYVSLKLCNYVISTSQDLAFVAYKYISPKKITVISNGYDSSIFNPAVILPKDLAEKYNGYKIIMTVRRLVPKNGIHFLVESMPFILKKIPSAKYLIIGDGRMREYLENRVKEMNISGSVEFLGSLSNDKIPAYLKLADVVVFPSTAESSSLACIEAMAMGKPIVSSRIGGLSELLSNQKSAKLVDLVPWTGSNYDAPLTLDNSKYKDLSGAIINALSNSNPEDLEKMAEYTGRNFNWRNISEKTVNVYNRLI